MKSLSKNLLASVFAQAIRYISPLLVLPFLTRTLDVSGFSHFVLLTAMSQMLGQCIEFGFGLMGVRELATFKSQPHKAAQISGIVLFGRLLTGCVSVVVFLAAALAFNVFGLANSPTLALCGVLLAICYGFSPSWYFIGIERASTQAYIDVGCAFATAVLIFLFVRGPGDVILALVAFIIPLLVAAIFGNILAAKKLGVIRPDFREYVAGVKESFGFFVLTAVSPLVSRLSLLSLGFFSSPVQVAFYAAGERLITAGVNATVPVVRVFMPRMAALAIDNDKAAGRFFRRTSFILCAGFSVIAGISIGVSPWAVPAFFGSMMNGGGTIVVAVLLLMLPTVVISRLVGLLGLLPLKQEKSYRRTSVVFALLTLVLSPLVCVQFGAIGLAGLRSGVELLQAVVLSWALYQLKPEWFRIGK